jgi:hypothetical protein
VEKEVLKVLTYFAYFSYPPTEKEVYTYVGVKTSHLLLKETLNTLFKKRKIIQKGTRYTLGGYGIFFKINAKRSLISQAKMQFAYTFIAQLRKISCIRLIGISGSLSMRNAKVSDDIDLFIIASLNKLWTARFLALICAQLMGVRRKRNDHNIQDKICMNLFFEESELTLPVYKRNRFTAHEVIQMVPLVNKDKTYERFLFENQWVKTYFPQIRIADRIFRSKKIKKDGISLVEKLLKIVQINIIKRHQTSELILQKQLWFFPQDVQKKLEKRKII